ANAAALTTDCNCKCERRSVINIHPSQTSQTSRKGKSSKLSIKSSKRRRKFCLGGIVMRDRKSFLLQIWLLCVALGTLFSGASPVQSQGKNGEWPSYAADLAGTRYRPLDQINASNFSDLEIAWRIKTDNFGDRPEYKL